MNSIKFDKTRNMDMVLLGRATIDLNPVDYFQTLSESTTFKKYVGGSPANIAIGLSRLGKKVGFVGKISEDRFGEYIYDFFKSENVDVTCVTKCTNGYKTGLTFTEILTPDESNILMYRNCTADLMLEPKDISREYIEDAKSVLLSGTALSQSPSREAVLKALFIANDTSTPVVFDLDFRPYNWANDEETAVYYQMVAEGSSIIIGSRAEFDMTEKLLDLDGSDETSAKYWFDKKAEIVIIKHGKSGSIAYVKSGETYTVKTFPVEAMKNFGGGDGYASAFLYGILEGWDIEQSLEYGSAEAAMLIASHACAPFMPSMDKLKEFIDKTKAKHGQMITKRNRHIFI